MEANEPKVREPLEEAATDQPQSFENDAHPRWREIFHQAFEKARRESKPVNRTGLGRDHSRSLFLLAGAVIAVLLLFFGVFSSPTRTRKSLHTRSVGTPNLGQKLGPGQQSNTSTGSPTPLLSAQVGSPDAAGSGGVTAEDVDRTARPVPPPMNGQRHPVQTHAPAQAAPYALGQIDFSNPMPGGTAPETPSATRAETDDLRKPSLVFVRSPQNVPTSSETRSTAAAVDDRPALALSAGTRLIARLESEVTTAVKDPVVATIEYNYEKGGEIIVPAGAKAIGAIQQADRSGNMQIRFTSLQMPNGSTEKMEASAMSLTYGPLKGNVSGKKTGTNFLVRTFTGLGQAATYLVGSGGMSAPLSESAFLRDRIATNIGIAGDQELNNLTFNQNIVVTVSGNTRFYIVMEGDTGRPEAAPTARQQSNTAPAMSVDDLRQLLQLRQELNAMYQQDGAAQSAAASAAQ
jgi:hypothetical protein